MKLAIVGSREYPRPEFVKAFVQACLENTDTLISGGARGVDNWAQEAAEACGAKTEIYLPNWDKYGKRAGFLRNSTIVEAADKLVAFWDGKSKGTIDSVQKAHKRHIPVLVFGPDRSVVYSYSTLLIIPMEK